MMFKNVVTGMEISVTKLSKIQAEQRDIEEWSNATPAEKLDLVQFLRDQYYEYKNETRKGLQRVYRIVKRV